MVLYAFSKHLSAFFKLFDDSFRYLISLSVDWSTFIVEWKQCIEQVAVANFPVLL